MLGSSAGSSWNSGLMHPSGSSGPRRHARSPRGRSPAAGARPAPRRSRRGCGRPAAGRPGRAPPRRSCACSRRRFARTGHGRTGTGSRGSGTRPGRRPSGRRHRSPGTRPRRRPADLAGTCGRPFMRPSVMPSPAPGLRSAPTIHHLQHLSGRRARTGRAWSPSSLETRWRGGPHALAGGADHVLEHPITDEEGGAGRRVDPSSAAGRSGRRLALAEPGREHDRIHPRRDALVAAITSSRISGGSRCWHIPIRSPRPRSPSSSA